MNRLTYNHALAKAFLGNSEYKRLENFFQKTWTVKNQRGEDYKYRVYLAQKCLTLNEVFWDAYRTAHPKLEQPLYHSWEQTFISQFALLLKARELAEDYEADCVFPNILIVDESASTGHDFCELIYRLERSVCRELSTIREHVLSLKESLEIHDALVAAVDFQVYMINENGLLLDDSLKACVEENYTGSQGAVHSLAFKVSNMIFTSSVAENTSFIPTFVLGRDSVPERDNAADLTERPQQCTLDEKVQRVHSCFESNGWQRENWVYRGKKTEIWQRTFGSSSLYGINVQAAIRCHYGEHDNRFWITPYMLWGELKPESIYQLLETIEKILLKFDQTELCQSIESILADRSEDILDMQIKFISSLMSVLLYQNAINSWDTGEVIFDLCDVDKVAQCFGTIQEMLDPVFFPLVTGKKPEMLKELWFRLLLLIEKEAAPLGKTDHNSTAGHDLFLLDAERVFYEMDDKISQKMQLRRKKGITFVPWSDYDEGDLSVTKLLSKFSARLPSLEARIGAVLVLLRHGIISCSTYAEHRDALSLKVGEATGSIRIMHMYRFFPALLELERICTANQLTTEKWAARFGAYLDENAGGGMMEQLFSSFTAAVYNNGMRFGDWAFNTLRMLDKPDVEKGVRSVQEWSGEPWPADEYARIKQMDKNRYIMWEEENQERYVNAVHTFFS